jgi:2,4-dienoyl-CoA reductase-like NADH-dependent reductase (Old Yellow Enzyme family)
MGSSIEPFVHLLSPLNMGSLRLKNRVVMASLTRNRDNVPRESLHVPYYSERARTGLIVSQVILIALFSFLVLL